MHRCLCLFSALLFYVSLQAQDTTFTLNLTPQSPEAAAFTKNTLMPMTLFEGEPNVSVPIFDVKTSKLHLPINLTYNYNGDRPGEFATWAGLGWNLSVGGAITRIVKGQVDDNSYMQAYAGALWANTSGHENNDFDDVANPSAIAGSVTNPQDYLTELAAGHIDGQPDVYVFNFCGYSGKFILIQGRPYLFPAQDLQITQNARSFLIITPDGTRYNFGLPEYTTVLNKGLNGPPMPNYNSAWHLLTITSADQSEMISLSYGNGGTGYMPNSMAQTFVKYLVVDNQDGANVPSNQFNGSVYAIGGSQVGLAAVSDIYTPEHHIHFGTDTSSRKDVVGAVHSLGNIQVYNVNNQLIRNVQLNHSYFGDTTNNQCKLRLDSVTITGTDTLVKEKYSFNYAGTPALSTSWDFDMWGYTNQASYNQPSLFDCSVLALSTSANFPGCGNRASAGGDGGILDQINYPTGGYAVFNYEQNTIYDGIHYNMIPQYLSQASTSSSTGYGTKTVQKGFYLNIAQTVYLNIIRQGALIKDYTVVGAIKDSTGAVIYQSAAFANGINYLSASETDSAVLQPGNYTLLVTSDNTDTLNTVQLTYVEQGSLIEGAPGPGVRVKEVDFYDNAYGTSPSLIKSYIYHDTTGLSTGTTLNPPGFGVTNISHMEPNLPEPGQPQISYIKTIYSSAFNTGTTPLLDQQFYYGKVTEINHDTIGNGKTEYYFSNSGDVSTTTLDKQISYKYANGQYIPLKENDYNYFDTGLVFFNGVTPIETDEAGGLSLDVTPGTTTAAPFVDTLQYRDKLFTATISSYWSQWQRLNSTTEITYDSTGANPVTQQVNYFYQSPNHFQVTMKTEKDSKGNAVVTKYKYPLDYPILTNPTVRSVDSTYYIAKQNAYNTYVNNDYSRYNAGILFYDSAQMYPAQGATWQSYLNKMTLVVRNNPCEMWYADSSQATTHRRDSCITQYFSALSTAIASGSYSPSQNAILLMQQNHIVNEPIEKTISIVIAGDTTLLSAQKNEYLANSYGSVYLDTIWETELNAPMAPATFYASPNSYYIPQESYVYDGYGNVATQYAIRHNKESYIWDYNHKYNIAEVENGDSASIAYTSFEADGTGNWSIPDTTRNRSMGITGNQSFNLNGTNAITKYNLLSANTYIVSYWSTGGALNVNGSTATAGGTVGSWTYYEHSVTGATTITVTGNATIDELRLFPKGALMTTQTYTPVVGMTSHCTPTNYITYYGYDDMSRLANIKDMRGNIIKTYYYHYEGQ